MDAEFVKIQYPEKIYGEKNLLESQLGLLSATNRIKNFKKLRSETFATKILLKKKIQNLKESLAHLEKFLPKSKIKLEEEEKQAIKKPVKEEEPKKPSIESEIDEIRKKLAGLR